jgi:hypothetical protein
MFNRTISSGGKRAYFNASVPLVQALTFFHNG